jgi:hypothetical protein
MCEIPPDSLPSRGNLWLPVTVVRGQFGEFLEGVTLPPHWREEVHRRVVEQ